MRRRRTARPGRVLIGTSGYVYPHWRQRFYPRKVPARAWLGFYARHFDTVELNNPFYRLPQARTFRAWREAVPEGFIFAVKASRFLTHLKRLKDPAAPLALFLHRVQALEATLGPVLFQLPGHFQVNLERLEGFLRVLGRQRRVEGLRAVLEVRHPSWLDPRVFDRLRDANVALCLADWTQLAVEEPLTANFVYVRRHGSGRRYGGSYPEATLRAEARRVRGWRADGRDVYVYFNNDALGHAVRNALRLADLVGRH